MAESVILEASNGEGTPRNDDYNRLAQLESRLRAAELARDEAIRDHHTIASSTAWKATAPLRALGRLLPKSARMAIRTALGGERPKAGLSASEPSFRDTLEKDVSTPNHLERSSNRTGRIQAILRCPTTGDDLVMSPDEKSLISAQGQQRWPILEGVPLLYPGMDNVRVVDKGHLSHPMPDEVIEFVRSKSDLILHLSAGGSAERMDNVVEAEAAVFRHTDVVADVHHLPFADESFAGVVAMNAFEHYRDPNRAAQEIFRVLKPGGRVFIRTAFMQPLHEAPWHFYNCTKYGLLEWFAAFETDRLRVSDNFHAGYSISWLAAECERALRQHASSESADRFLDTPMRRIVDYWRSPETRDLGEDLIWKALAELPQEAQESVAAGFEYVGVKPI